MPGRRQLQAGQKVGPQSKSQSSLSLLESGGGGGGGHVRARVQRMEQSQRQQQHQVASTAAARKASLPGASSICSLAPVDWPPAAKSAARRPGGASGAASSMIPVRSRHLPPSEPRRARNEPN